MRRLASWFAVLLLACAGGAAPQVVLRVGTSGDYAPFSLRDPAGRRDGFDVAVARAYAQERGLAIHWVPLHWATLDRDFAAGRFDVVMSGVTVRPERSVAGRFSLPVVQSGAVLLTHGTATSAPLPAGARIAVNAGGHLERVARGLFPDATLRPLSPNAAVREALLAGAVDAAVSDTLEAPGWLEGTSGLHVLGPFTRDWKAYWLPAAASEREHDLDAWLSAREADGSLAALRAHYLPEAARQPGATALVALGAAIEERLSLMPMVAEAKRATGAKVRDPAQEKVVLGVALDSVRDAAERERLVAPADGAVHDFFLALIDAACEVQERTLAGPAPAAAGPPLADPPQELAPVLRPALARISERIAWLLVRLPQPLDGGALEDALTPIERSGVAPATRERIADALHRLHTP